MAKLVKYSTFEALKAISKVAQKPTEAGNKGLSEFEQLFSLLKNNSALQKNIEASRGE